MAAGAETVVLEATERGLFREDGSYELGPQAAYSTGRGAQGEERSIFVFDLAPLTGTVKSARLRIRSPGSVSPDRSETVAVYAVSSDPSLLVWEPAPIATPAVPPKPGVGTFWDLGEGAALGSAKVDTRSPGWVEVHLDRAILRVLERSGGLVALGLRVTSLRGRKGVARLVEERVFVGAGPGSNIPRPRLVLVTTPRFHPGPAQTLHVDARYARSHASGSEHRPFRTISAALDLATPGDTLAVAPGYYFDTMIMKEGIDVRGAGADRTMLDLGRNLPSVRCAYATIDGFLVARTPPARGTFPRLPRPPRFGEAIDCTNGTSPTLSNDTVWGDIRLAGSHATIVRSEFGGFISGVDSSPTVSENQISGAIELTFEDAGSSPPFHFERNRIRGALRLTGEAPSGNRIVGNAFLPGPGVLFFRSGGLSIASSGDLGLIASNTFFATRGLEFCRPRPITPGPFPLPNPPLGRCEDGPPGSSAIIANNVMAFGEVGISLAPNASATIVHNDVFQNRGFPFFAGGNYLGLPDLTGIDGNLSEDPRIVLSGDEIWHAAGSPTLDAGANERAASEVDLDGDPRVAAAVPGGPARIDIGAEEHQPEEGFPVRAWVRIDGRLETNPFTFDRLRVIDPGRPLRMAILSDESLGFVLPSELDAASLRLGGIPPLEPCAAEDVDEDGDDDLVCVFPFAAVDGLANLVTKRLCLNGETRERQPIRGCDQVIVNRFPLPSLR